MNHKHTAGPFSSDIEFVDGIVLKQYFAESICELFKEEDNKNLQNKVNVVIGRVLRSYGGEGRYYHNLNHLCDVLNQWEIETQQDNLHNDYIFVQDWNKSFLALVYHDIVYDSKSNSNEEDSVLVMKNDMNELIPEGTADKESIISEIADLILTTKNYARPNYHIKTVAESIVWASDLKPMFSDMSNYSKHLLNVRKEYSFVPNDI